MIDDDADRLPPPPWSSEVDLGVFQAVEIPRRLVTSELFADLEPPAWRAQMRLIFTAWHERPAGSLPGNQRVLADAAGLGGDLAAWSQVEHVLELWRYCSDNRFYCTALEDVILAAWGRRSARRGQDAKRQALRRFRAALGEAGVAQVERLGADRVGRALQAFLDRGGDQMRGDARRELVVRIASDLGLLPGEEMRSAGVADLRMFGPRGRSPKLE